MVSDRAIELMEQVAQSVGFGSRSDYPHLGASPISVGDWKGASIAACVFANLMHAQRYRDECLGVLDALGGGLRGDILKVDPQNHSNMYIVVITATDLVGHKEAKELY